MGFKKEINGDGYKLFFNDKLIAHGSKNYGYNIIRDLVVHAGKDDLIAIHQLAPTEFGHIETPVEISTDANQAKITLECENQDQSMHHVGTASITFNAEDKSFHWDFVHKTEVVKPYELKKLFERTDPDKEFDGKGAWVFEITDPIPTKPFAPKDGPISIDRPDIQFPRAWFRKNGWNKNWRFFAFSRKDGKTIRIPMNHLDNHDKDFWKQSSNGFMALLGGNGTNIRYRFLEDTGKNISHHYCMWGYDIHFWETIAPGTGKEDNPAPVLPVGYEFYHHYVLEALSDAESEQILLEANDHPWRERDQKRLENAPAYNTGINYFQRGLGRQDDGGFFEAASECKFLPNHPGRIEPGVLLIENNHCQFDGSLPHNSWDITLGSDQWHTPIESGKSYEISVWAKLEHRREEKSTARIAMKYIQQFNQGTPEFRVERSEPFYSNTVTGKSGWEKLTLITPELPDGYICSFIIALEFHGRGTCYFDEFECKVR
jgi:hypothetical protein